MAQVTLALLHCMILCVCVCLRVCVHACMRTCVCMCVKTFVARRRHEGSKETSLARIKGKNIIAKRFDSYAAVIISGLYRKAGEMLA